MPYLDLWGSTELWVLTGLCFLGTLVWRVIGTTIATNTIMGSQKIMAEVGTLSPTYLTVIQRSEENNNAPSMNAW